MNHNLRRDVAAQNPGVAQRLKDFADQVFAKPGERDKEGTEVRAAGFVDQAKPLNASAATKRKDVLFIAFDDMNDWTQERPQTESKNDAKKKRRNVRRKHISAAKLIGLVKQ